MYRIIISIEGFYGVDTANSIEFAGITAFYQVVDEGRNIFLFDVKACFFVDGSIIIPKACDFVEHMHLLFVNFLIVSICEISKEIPSKRK